MSREETANGGDLSEVGNAPSKHGRRVAICPIIRTSRTAGAQAASECPISRSGKGSPVQVQLQDLERADLVQLRAEWRRLFGSDPPRLSRDLLSRALAYRVQERAFGGLSRANVRRLQDLAKDRPDADSGPGRPVLLRPGAKLVREWHGRTHVVTVTEAGFGYAGASYASLTEIAKLITGAHWSGPRFFGLMRGRSGRPSADV